MWKRKRNSEKRHSKESGAAEKEKIKPIRSEKEVGIILHLGKHEKFDAVVKHRYSDFHVNEIDPTGRIVHLTSYDLPVDSRERVDETDPIFQNWLNEEVRSRVEILQSSADRGSNSDGNLTERSVEINVTDTTKNDRTKIHRWLSAYDKLTSETIDRDGQKLIVISVQSSKGRRFLRRPANRGKFTHCVLYKEGIDTTDAIGYLTRKLQLRPNHVTFAGTKDKQAKTTQRICFSNIDASRLLELNKYSTQSRLGNFEYQSKRLNLGDLSGNHFKLLLKNVQSKSETIIQTAVENLRTQGFINYFGLQRFGSYAAPTHLIGKALIQMKFDQVIDLILEPKPNDPEFMSKAKNIWFTTRNAEDAVKLVPSWCRSIESSLLLGLSKYYAKRDYQSSLSCIPRNMRLLYLHAYQSYTWNRIASYRIKEYGLIPVVGDLVYVDPQSCEVSADVLDQEDCCYQDEGRNDEPPDKVQPENTACPSLSPAGRIPKVKILTTEEIHNHTIYDIVIPLQGTDIVYPKNKVCDYFDELRLDGGIGTECCQTFNTRANTPKGAYRKLIVIPKDVSYKIIPYSDTDELDTFIPSELDLMESKEINSLDPVISQDGLPKDKKCIVLEISLPTSSYATMALREILRGEEPRDLEVETEKTNLVEETYNKEATENPDLDPDVNNDNGSSAKKTRIE